MYLSLINNLLFSKELQFSYLLPKEHDILSIFDDNSLKTQAIRFKQIALESIRLTLQVNIKIVSFGEK